MQVYLLALALVNGAPQSTITAMDLTAERCELARQDRAAAFEIGRHAAAMSFGRAFFLKPTHETRTDGLHCVPMGIEPADYVAQHIEALNAYSDKMRAERYAHVPSHPPSARLRTSRATDRAIRMYRREHRVNQRAYGYRWRWHFLKNAR